MERECKNMEIEANKIGYANRKQFQVLIHDNNLQPKIFYMLDFGKYLEFK